MMSEIKKEIERKYLLKRMPDINSSEILHIKQFYISSEPEIRVRSDGKNFYLCKKGKGMLIREETETLISEEVVNILVLLRNGIVIEKQRYKLNSNGYIWEIDNYLEPYIGLVIAEIELLYLQQEVVIPECFELIAEVTYNKRFKNKLLALQPISISELFKLAVGD